MNCTKKTYQKTNIEITSSKYLHLFYLKFNLSEISEFLWQLQSKNYYSALGQGLGQTMQTLIFKLMNYYT